MKLQYWLILLASSLIWNLRAVESVQKAIHGELQSPLNPTEERENRENECNQDCSGVVEKPVCGTDGRTYQSRCELQVARCLGNGVQMRDKGRCAQEKFRCLSERAHAEELAKQQMSGIFKPDCNEDGSYAEVQCHTSTGYCWCVTQDGKLVPGSARRYDSPICNKRPECSMIDREEFNRNLLSKFKEEYLRLTIEKIEESVSYLYDVSTPDSSLKDNTHKKVIDWKFSELDSNRNLELSKKELKSIKRLIRKIVQPKKCARTFVKYCDLDNDIKISYAEWSVCLGFDNIFFRFFISLNSDEDSSKNNSTVKEERTVGPPDMASRVTGSKTKPSLITVQIIPTNEPDTVTKEAESCFTERKQAQTSSNVGAFIPECTEDNKFKAMQCHESLLYCWCVKPENGKLIPGTARENQQPDCESIASSRANKVIKDCPEKTELFVQQVIEKITTEMKEETRLFTESQEELTTLPFQELKNVMSLKFGQLDSDGNNIIDKEEAKLFEQEITNLKPKKCARNFMTFCDVNRNEQITRGEWISCLESGESKLKNKPQHSSVFGRLTK